jgi:hypothetical protein
MSRELQEEAPFTHAVLCHSIEKKHLDQIKSDLVPPTWSVLTMTFREHLPIAQKNKILWHNPTDN